jgi:ketosteroid isomerase-like protein
MKGDNGGRRINTAIDLPAFRYRDLPRMIARLGFRILRARRAEGRIITERKTMRTEISEVTAEAQIRGRTDDWLKALHDKDIDRVMAHYASGILVCDLAPPLRRIGSQALKQSLEEWFRTWEGPIGFEIRDLLITAGVDIAYCHGLKRISGRKTDGEEPEVWTRVTLCFRKIDGEWRITHEHESVPFYMDGSVRAAVDLEP